MHMAQIATAPTAAGPHHPVLRMLAFSLMLCAGPLAADEHADARQGIHRSSTLASRFQPGSIRSGETAERALNEAGQERAEIEARFGTNERACLGRFFVNGCVTDAKERRQHALADVRKVEVEANAVLRRLRIEEHDRELAEKRSERERKEAERFKDSVPVSDLSAALTNTPAPEAGDVAPAAHMSDRQARHEAKLRQMEEKERAEAQTRAEKAAAYERKVIDAHRRQQAVEAKTSKEAKK
jgi:colicin import membrane protein